MAELEFGPKLQQRLFVTRDFVGFSAGFKLFISSSEDAFGRPARRSSASYDKFDVLFWGSSSQRDAATFTRDTRTQAGKLCATQIRVHSCEFVVRLR
jgi:hypothetical protein